MRVRQREKQVRLSDRQTEVLRILVEYDAECWGEVWTQCDFLRWGVRGTHMANFDRVGNALVRKGLVIEGRDRLEVTVAGRAALGVNQKSR